MGAVNRGRSLGTAYERALLAEGFLRPAGVDEAGRGCLAGPVVAAAVILDGSRRIQGLQDSKKLNPAERERLYEVIQERALAVSVGSAGHDLVDRLNIHQASLQAMREAVETLPVPADCALVDGMHLPGLRVPHRSLIGGDGVCASIAAASIVAKVTRDRWMQDLHERYPAYNFASNKGYGTEEHLEALAVHGPCPYHRRTFRGVEEPRLPFDASTTR